VENSKLSKPPYGDYTRASMVEISEKNIVTRSRPHRFRAQLFTNEKFTAFTEPYAQYAIRALSCRSILSLKKWNNFVDSDVSLATFPDISDV